MKILAPEPDINEINTWPIKFFGRAMEFQIYQFVTTFGRS